MYWVVVGLATFADWFRHEGHHIRNRTILAALVTGGALLLEAPLWAALMLAAGIWIWAAMPMQWPRATSAAGIAAGAGIMAWALDLSLF
ncbi:hypothetical protein [Falsiroseomonas ponticola]|uniref:hypothetical protein n=1 Tax=Falsiroseomonas ponticola TaxID=2786951 RepID=UPI00193297C8|nr:hypothetical protein [Roseomonas ponticola]